jgi:hypothetical protein
MGTADVSFTLNKAELVYANFVPVTGNLFACTYDIFKPLLDYSELTIIEHTYADEDEILIDENIPLIPSKVIHAKARIGTINFGKVYRPLLDTEEDYLIDE